MERFNFQPTPLTAIRRSSLEVPKSIIKPASSAIRRLSSSTSTGQKDGKTVTFSTSVVATVPKTESKPLHALPYHLRTAHLFTRHDIKTIIVPQTIFGLLNAYHLTATHSNDSRLLQSLLSRTPLVIIWIYANLLPFCISNQIQPGSIAEDRINKPFRPLASQRITPSTAKLWRETLHLAALVLSLRLDVQSGSSVGATAACLALTVLGYLYNDLAWSEKGWARRNVLTGLGYSAFGVGALHVALPSTAGLSVGARMWLWLAMLAAVIATTGHVTDIADLEGDRARGRKTAPIVLGETLGRWSVVVSVAVWSLVCPWVWGVRFLGFVMPVFVGGKIVQRLLTMRGREDKKTFLIWNGWVAVLYLIPLLGGDS